MKVLLGLSGGVDSAVAAYLLLKEGYEVTGAFMRNWDAMANNDYLGNPTVNDDQCPQEKDYQDAKDVAERLGIPLLRVDFVKEYWDNVFSYFLKEYERGRTPNPDVFCNKYIKFDSFLKFAKEKGFDKISMGHYAKKANYEGIEYIYKANDKNKDQSYFLCQLNEEQISSCIFPLADISKLEVRSIAKTLDLESVMNKKDSTGVCFIGERNFRKFLNNYFPAQKGKIIDIKTNKILGEHMGVLYYTLGQRHGLGIGGVKGEACNPWFVCQKDVQNNILFVSNGDEDEHLLSSSCRLSNINFVGPRFEGERLVNVKFRYRQCDNPCWMSFDNDSILLRYVSPVKAVTPGQIAAIYDGERMLGGGIIEEILH